MKSNRLVGTCVICGEPAEVRTCSSGYQYLLKTCGKPECGTEMRRRNTIRQMASKEARDHLRKVVSEQHKKEGNKARFKMTDEIRNKIGSAQAGKRRAWQDDEQKMNHHRQVQSKAQKERFASVGVENHELFRPEVREKAIEASNVERVTNPRRGRFETNCAAKMWFLITPRGERFAFRNLNHFIREHQQYFTARQLECPDKTVPSATRASMAMSQLRPSNKRPSGVSCGFIWDLEAEMEHFKKTGEWR